MPGGKADTAPADQAEKGLPAPPPLDMHNGQPALSHNMRTFMRTSPLILHDSFTLPGTQERAAQALAELTGGILWTARFEQQAFPPDFFKDRPPMDMRAAGKFPGLARKHELACFWKCFRQFPPARPPMTIFTGHAALAAWRNVAGKRVFYCYAPPRFLYDQQDLHLPQHAGPGRLARKAFLWTVKRAWSEAIHSMDQIVSSSQGVAHWLGRHLQLDSVIVPAPVLTRPLAWISQKDFYLCCANTGSTRMQLLVETFLALPHKHLVVAADGHTAGPIRAMAAGAPNIAVLDRTEEALQQLLGTCLATIYIPCGEDFDLPMVESMAAGKPVIAMACGGDPGPLKDGKTGLLVDANPDAALVARAVEAMSAPKALAMRQACEAQAALFRREAFIDGMARVLERLR